MKFLTKTNIMKICTRLSTAFTVWYLMFGDSYTILSKNRSIILVILFVLISLIVLIPLHLGIVHPIIGAVLSGSVIIYQAIAITHNIKERRKKKKQKKSGAIPSV